MMKVETMRWNSVMKFTMFCSSQMRPAELETVNESEQEAQVISGECEEEEGDEDE